MGSSWTTVIGGVVTVLALPVLISYIVEAVRSAPATPPGLNWAPKIPIKHIKVNGVSIRYIDAGQGPPLVLLHTLRTQLDVFQKIIPELSKHFKVYALDYPGHGFSDIPPVEYSPEFFTNVVAGFLEQLNIKEATVAGESIGGSIALRLATRHDLRVKRVIAINAYDYDAGRGVMRSSPVAKLLFSLNNVPILGSTFWRFRQYPAFKNIIEGGVVHKDALPPALLREMYEVGNRPHHYQALMSLVATWAGWEDGRKDYGKVTVPVLLLYGEHDWSRPEEREANQRAIPGAQMAIVKDAGHFLSLDAHEAVIQHILNFSSFKEEGGTGVAAKDAER